MNYIKHLNNVFIMIAEDDRLSPGHVSLYMALFQLWNLNHFENPISITRAEMKKASKVGSNNTYVKYLKELTEWNYIQYKPSYNPFIGSEVNLYRFDTSTVQALIQERLKSGTGTVQALIPPINNIKLYKHKERETEFEPPTLEALKIFFKKMIEEKRLNISSHQEAEKFYNHYQSNGWKVGKNAMKDWQAAATNWLLKSAEFNKSEKPLSGHLHTYQNKDYDQPL